MHAITLKTTEYKDKDLIIQLLTDQQGKINLYAARQRSGTKHGQSRLEVFDSGTIELGKKRGDLYSLKFFKPISSFPHIRDSLNKMSLAGFLCEATGQLLAEDCESDGVLFPLLHNALTEIAITGEHKIQLRIAYLYFAKLMAHAGLIDYKLFEQPSLNRFLLLVNVAEQHSEQKFKSRSGLDLVLQGLKL